MGNMDLTLLSLDFEVKMSFCFVKTQFIEETGRYIKENFAYCQSLYSCLIREPRGGFVYRVI